MRRSPRWPPTSSSGNIVEGRYVKRLAQRVEIRHLKWKLGTNQRRCRRWNRCLAFLLTQGRRDILRRLDCISMNLTYVGVSTYLFPVGPALIRTSSIKENRMANYFLNTFQGGCFRRMRTVEQILSYGMETDFRIQRSLLSTFNSDPQHRVSRVVLYYCAL